MKNLLPLLTIAFSCAVTPLILAQDDNDKKISDQTSDNRFWEANLPGGSYMVSLARISSISMSTYHVKGAIVHEVDVETMGSALARFYAIEALGENSDLNVATNTIARVKEVTSLAGERLNVNTDTTVHKEYPTTTHAKTVEFRVVSKEDLSELYKSLSKSWRSNRGRKITIK